MRILCTGLLGALTFVAPGMAQVVVPLPDGAVYPYTVGQPSLVGASPICDPLVDPGVLYLNGNPNLTVSTDAPYPVPEGSPTALLIIFSTRPPIPLGLVFPFCGYSGSPEWPFMPPLISGCVAFPAPPAPGGPLAMPLPPGIPPGLRGMIMITIGLDAETGCVFVTNGIRFGT